MEEQQIDFELKFVWKLLRWLGIDFVSQNQEADGPEFKTLVFILLSIVSIFPKIASKDIFLARIHPAVHCLATINRSLIILVWLHLYFNKNRIRRILMKLDKISNPSLKTNLLMQSVLCLTFYSHVMLTTLSILNRERLVFFKYDYVLVEGVSENALVIININLHFFFPLLFPVMLSFIYCTICCRLRDALEIFNSNLRLRTENQIPFQGNVLATYQNIVGAVALFDRVFSEPSLLLVFVLLSNVISSLRGFRDEYIDGDVLEPMLILIPSTCCIVAIIYYAAKMMRIRKDIKERLHGLHLRIQGTESAERTVVEAMNRREVYTNGKTVLYQKDGLVLISLIAVALAVLYSMEKCYFPLSL